ncbi:MAG: radical SAM protein, partial [Phycisphaerae bacterium]|nr:radical SAM protein [Phycisphaerae bacterium]
MSVTEQPVSPPEPQLGVRANADSVCRQPEHQEDAHRPPCPDLDRLQTTDPQIRQQIASRHGDQATDLAAKQVATALADLAVVRLASGDLEIAVRLLQEALDLCPGSRPAFHNLVAALLLHKHLRDANFDAVRGHLLQHWDDFPWVRQYRRLLFMPCFLNLEFVKGKCNLKCRMCVGANAPDHPNRLTYMSAEDFRGLLTAAPTITGVTLSSGDSDPLLHPDIVQVIDMAAEHHVRLDVFTNGLPLGVKTCRRIVESQTVSMVNFSIDAATPETYRRIRGEDLTRVVKKIETLQTMKNDTGSHLPRVSLSFVAMADNIQELPAFVEMARRLGATRVFVDDLIGWGSGDSENQVATDHPRCFHLVQRARRLAEGANIQFTLPERLQHEPGAGPVAGAASNGAATGPPLSRCGWINGVWVRRDGQLDPCCMVQNVADMGNIKDGPILRNDKYARVKDLLLDGKIFKACVNQRMCRYVQQQKAADIPLRLITRDE